MAKAEYRYGLFPYSVHGLHVDACKNDETRVLRALDFYYGLLGE